jgi:hypothetical protein
MMRECDCDRESDRGGQGIATKNSIWPSINENRTDPSASAQDDPRTPKSPVPDRAANRSDGVREIFDPGWSGHSWTIRLAACSSARTQHNGDSRSLTGPFPGYDSASSRCRPARAIRHAENDNSERFPIIYFGPSAFLRSSALAPLRLFSSE